MVTSFSHWAIIVYLTYRIGLRLPVFRGMIYFVMDASVNTQILIFVCILFLIEERFRHLCNMMPFSKDESCRSAYFISVLFRFYETCVSAGKRRGSSVFPIAEGPYCSYCWHYKCLFSSFTFDILSSDDLFSHPYLKRAADVSTILLSPVKKAREA